VNDKEYKQQKIQQKYKKKYKQEINIVNKLDKYE